MAGSGFLGRLKQFDAYPKTLEDFKIKTYFGAASEGIVYSVCVSVWVWRYVCVLGPWEGGGKCDNKYPVVMDLQSPGIWGIPL